MAKSISDARLSRKRDYLFIDATWNRAYKEIADIGVLHGQKEEARQYVFVTYI